MIHPWGKPSSCSFIFIDPSVDCICEYLHSVTNNVRKVTFVYFISCALKQVYVCDHPIVILTKWKKRVSIDLFNCGHVNVNCLFFYRLFICLWFSFFLTELISRVNHLFHFICQQLLHFITIPWLNIIFPLTIFFSVHIHVYNTADCSVSLLFFCFLDLLLNRNWDQKPFQSSLLFLTNLHKYFKD